MKVIKKLEEERVVRFDCGMISNRILLEKDNMGFTLTKTEIPVGDWRHWHYKNHLEACYCISGGGILHDVAKGEKYIIKPGTTYVLDDNDNHEFKAYYNTVLICVFNPPLTGQERHLKDGSYR
jgi:L-ectoine synthase